MEPGSETRFNKKNHHLLAPTGRYMTAQVKRGEIWRPEGHQNRAQAWVMEVIAKNDRVAQQTRRFVKRTGI